LTAISTLRLGEHLPLLDLLPKAAPLAWVRGGDGLVGWGVHARKTVSGPNRFRDARNWWHQQLETFSVSDSVHASGTGPILFASFTFAESEESELIIPEIIVGQRNGKSWLTWIGDGPQPILPTTKSIATAPNLNWHADAISQSDWEAQVKNLLREIQGGQVSKVVLARDQSATSSSEIDARYILRNLATEYPSTWNFAINGLVGATPELLLRLSKGMVTSRVLAGTIAKTGDDERDLALAGSLARSSKDLEEHNYAVTSVVEAIEPFCSSTNVPESPFVLHLTNVMHLATDVTGALVETNKQVDSFSLLEKLHPSAAVCGTPTKAAFDLIAANEGIKRGRYAGPVGWIDASGDGELGIALRCGQITGEEIRIFAGCGIVNGSIPAKEFAESEAKFAAMRSALS
jgi:menaquinone-specific isochorismate synthase